MTAVTDRMLDVFEAAEAAHTHTHGGDFRRCCYRAGLEAVAPHIAAVHDSAWCSIWLHGDWRWLTMQMTTEEKRAVADAVERQWSRDEADDPGLTYGPETRTHLRWWEQ